MWIQRLAVFCVGGLATLIAIFVPLIYWLFILAADVVFVTVLPQLTCALFLKFTNTYGAITGFVTGLVFRISAGEEFLKIPPFIKYPFYNDDIGQTFPFRTFSMIFSLLAIISVSLFTNILFSKQILPSDLDLFNVTENSNQRTTMTHFHDYSAPREQHKHENGLLKSHNISNDKNEITENVTCL